MRRISTALLCLMLCCGLFGQGPTKLVDGAGNELVLAKGGQRYTAYLQAITTGGVTITTVPTNVQLLFCTNSSGSAATLTVADTQGSPVTFWTAVSIAANSVMLMHASTVGLFMQGIKLTAGTNSALSCQVQGVQ